MSKINKIFIIFTFFITMVATTQPMNRLARAITKKATLASQRLVSLALKNSVPARYVNHNQHNYQGKTNFSRPYPWLPALGAIATLGLNATRDNQASCLTIGYSMFMINNNTLLVIMPDFHVDFNHLRVALNHATQMRKIQSHAEKLLNCNVFFNIEYRKALQEDNGFILNSYILGESTFQGYHPGTNSQRAHIRFKDEESLVKGKGFAGAVTMNAAIGRAILKKNGKTKSKISYENFDERILKKDGVDYEADLPKFLGMLAKLPAVEQHKFIQEYYHHAQEIARQSMEVPALLEAVQLYYTTYCNSWLHGHRQLDDGSLCNEYEQLRLPESAWSNIVNLPSTTRLLSNIVKQSKTEGINIIFLCAGAKHSSDLVEMAAPLTNSGHHTIQPIKRVSVLYESELDNFMNTYEEVRSNREKEKLFVQNFADPIIAEIENWLQQTELEQQWRQDHEQIS